MRYIRDTVHGFRERRHYDEAELDTMFEKAVMDFLRNKHGEARFTVSSDDITTLIEQEVADLDQYTDLSCYGQGVEGMTEFPRSGKPRVSISESVHRYENRLRTTLTHEYGHCSTPIFSPWNTVRFPSARTGSPTPSTACTIRCSPSARGTGWNGRQATPPARR